ncbi:MAG: hypothetical protein ACOC8X_09695 [Chloroflexota bacterium]
MLAARERPACYTCCQNGQGVQDGPFRRPTFLLSVNSGLAIITGFLRAPQALVLDVARVEQRAPPTAFHRATLDTPFSSGL